VTASLLFAVAANKLDLLLLRVGRLCNSRAIGDDASGVLNGSAWTRRLMIGAVN